MLVGSHHLRISVWERGDCSYSRRYRKQNSQDYQCPGIDLLGHSSQFKPSATRRRAPLRPDNSAKPHASSFLLLDTTSLSNHTLYTSLGHSVVHTTQSDHVDPISPLLGPDNSAPRRTERNELGRFEIRQRMVHRSGSIMGSEALAQGWTRRDAI